MAAGDISAQMLARRPNYSFECSKRAMARRAKAADGSLTIFDLRGAEPDESFHSTNGNHVHRDRLSFPVNGAYRMAAFTAFDGL
jgi:hypothetical protein